MWYGIGLMVALIAVLVVRAWLAHRQIQAQLTTHKQMTPQQIAGARRSYLRGLYRQGPHRLRAAALVLAALATLLLLYGLMGVLERHNATLGVMPLAFGTGSDDSASFGLLGAAVVGLPACGIGAYLVFWRTQTELAANAKVAATKPDLYWTPATTLRQLQWLDWAGLTFTAIGLVSLAVANQLGALAW